MKYAQEMNKLRVRLGCPLDKQTPVLKGMVEEKLSLSIGVPIELEFCKPEEIPMSAHKVIRIIDLTKGKM